MQQERLTRGVSYPMENFRIWKQKHGVKVMVTLEMKTKINAPVIYAKKVASCHASRVILREGKQFPLILNRYRERIYGPSGRSTWGMPLGDIVLLSPLAARPSERPAFKQSS